MIIHNKREVARIVYYRRAAGPFSWLVLYCVGPRLEKKHSGEIELFRNKKQSKRQNTNTRTLVRVLAWRPVRTRAKKIIAHWFRCFQQKMVPGQFRRAAGPFSWLILYCTGPRLEKKHSGEIELFRNKKTKQKAKHQHTNTRTLVRVW